MDIPNLWKRWDEITPQEQAEIEDRLNEIAESWDTLPVEERERILHPMLYPVILAEIRRILTWETSAGRSQAEIRKRRPRRR